MANNFYGFKPEPLPVRDYLFDVCCGAAENVEIPEEYELPQELLPPVYDQRDTYMCVAYASCSCAESETMKRGEQKRFSPAFSYARKECRGDYTGEGMFGSTAIKGFVDIGFVPFLLFSIDDIDVPDIIRIASERDDLLEIAKNMKPNAYVSMNYALDDKKWETIKQAIFLHKRPLLIVSRDYFGGGHAVMAYGYTTTKGKTKGRFLKFQNSWGAEWSGDGRSEIPIHRVNEAYMMCWEELNLPFTDVAKNDWFYSEVKAAYFAGLMQGKSDTKFAPNENMIRGDVALMISRLLEKFEYSVNCFVKTKIQEGKPAKTISFAEGTKVKFRDVADGDYYKSAIAKVYANGVMNGVTDTTFEPESFLTRAEASTIIVRTLEMMRDKLNEAFLGNACKLTNSASAEIFKDVKASEWYYPYVMQSVKYGIMHGNGDGTFAPQNNISRAEVAAIFNRLFKQTDVLLKQLV